MKIAVFPGSFDPVTKGHESIILRALPLFDKIIIAIGINTVKKYLFTMEKRKQWLQKVFEGENKISVESYSGLTINFCIEKKAQYILRGLRSPSDYEFERSIAQMNHAMTKEIETIFIQSTPELSAINSTIVRDIIINGGDVKKFIPDTISIPAIPQP